MRTTEPQLRVHNAARTSVLHMIRYAGRLLWNWQNRRENVRKTLSWSGRRCIGLNTNHFVCAIVFDTFSVVLSLPLPLTLWTLCISQCSQCLTFISRKYVMHSHGTWHSIISFSLVCFWRRFHVKTKHLQWIACAMWVRACVIEFNSWHFVCSKQKSNKKTWLLIVVILLMHYKYKCATNVCPQISYQRRVDEIRICGFKHASISIGCIAASEWDKTGLAAPSKHFRLNFTFRQLKDGSDCECPQSERCQMNSVYK